MVLRCADRDPTAEFGCYKIASHLVPFCCCCNCRRTNVVDRGQPVAASEACIDGLISVTQWEVGVIDDLFQKDARQ
jgi:hypothetical protein